MRYVYSLIILLFLYSPVYSASINVTMYGAYSFEQKTLTTYWMSATNYTSYKVYLYEVTTSNTACPRTSTEKLLRSLSTVDKHITFNDVSTPATVRVLVKGVINTSEVQVADQEFWIHIIPRKYGVDWCIDDTPGVTLTGTTIYYTEVPSFTFSNSEDLTTWQSKTFSKEHDYGYKINMVLTAKYRSTGSTSELESPHSAQLVLFAGLPDKPEWQGINE